MSRFIPPEDPSEFHLGTSASAVSTPTVARWPTNFEDWLKANIRTLDVTLDLPSELQQWIGKIASYWALAEWVQAGTLARVLGINRKEARVMFGDRIGNCVSKIKQNMEIKDIPVPANFGDLASLLTECEKHRNLLCHGIWMKDPDTGELCVQNPSGEWNPPSKQKVSKRKYPEAIYPDRNSLSQVLEQMKAAIRNVQNLDRYLDKYLPPSPHRAG